MTDTFTPVGPTAGQLDASAVIGNVLAQYGLTALSSWAWQEVTKGGTSAAQITLDMYDQPAFQQRFPGIFARQKAGLPPISPADYVNYENQAKQIEHAYALPSGFLSDPNRIGTLVGGDVSISEVQDRVQKGYSVVTNAPPEVRQKFTEMFGHAGDGALASFFMDPAQATPHLERMAQAADIGGRASDLNINFGSDTALHLADLGMSGVDVRGGVTSLGQRAGLFDQQMGDVRQLDIGQQGVAAQFGLDAGAQQQVEAEQAAKKAAAMGGGGAEISQFGTGIGAAQAT